MWLTRFLLPVAQLVTVCDRVRADENFLRLVTELRPQDLPPQKAGAAVADAGAKMDARLAASLDALFGASSPPLAPITDIAVVYKGEPVPEGYVKARVPVPLRFLRAWVNLAPPRRFPSPLAGAWMRI